MKMESVQPYELLTALPEASKQQFYRMAKFDYARFAGLFDLSPKKNLIIIGTSHSSAASEQQQGGLCGTDHTAVRQRLRHLLQAPSRRQLVGRLPRPVRGADAAAGSDAVRNLRLGALDKIDMIGGYPSTTFISVPLDKVGFLFAADADGLVRPLNILFRDAANVEWIQ